MPMHRLATTADCRSRYDGRRWRAERSTFRPSLRLNSEFLRQALPFSVALDYTKPATESACCPGFFTFFAPRRNSVSIERVQLERRAAGRVRPPSESDPRSLVARSPAHQRPVSRHAHRGGERRLGMSAGSTSRGGRPMRPAIATAFISISATWTTISSGRPAIQPTRVTPDAYEFQFTEFGGGDCPARTAKSRCRLTVCVAPDHDFELRRCRLDQSRQPAAADRTHELRRIRARQPGCRRQPSDVRQAVRRDGVSAASRRRSSPAGGRAAPTSRSGLASIACWSMARLPTASVEFETNRKRFIGRGRSIAAPQALDPGAQLTGDEGPVLDPIGSLRTVVALAAGRESRRRVSVGCGIGPRRDRSARRRGRRLRRRERTFLPPPKSNPCDGNGDAERVGSPTPPTIA